MVICGYCGRQYHAAPPAPPPQHFAAPLPPPAPPAVTRVWIIAAVLGLVMMLGVGFFVFAMFMRVATSVATANAGAHPASPAKPASAPAGPPGLQHRWMSRHDPVFTRGTGQWVNVVGMVDFGTADMAMVDGATGKFVWHVPAPINSEVYTDGVERILAYDAAKRVMRYDAKTGKVLWTITVADFVHEITFGSGCASLRFGKPLGIDTETGQLKDCTPTRPALLRVEWDQPHDFAARRGDVDFSGTIQLDNKPINADPPRILVKASRAGRELWRTVVTTLEPIWTSDGFVRSVALTPNGVFVFGRNPADHQGRWVLLDPNTGATVLTSGFDDKVDGELWLVSGGPQVFVNYKQRLLAFAPTGKLAWHMADP